VRKKIHPEYHDVTVTCACGEKFKTRSTRKEMRLELCSKCHPFFTGRQKLIDTAGRVERFTKRYGDRGKAKAAAEATKAQAGKPTTTSRQS
jgi:large subunit ribosomal protein L31